MTNIIKINPDCNFNINKKEQANKVNDIRNSYFVRIPCGEYEAVLSDYYSCNICGTDKVVFLFTIVDFGDYHNVIIPRFYSVKRLIGKKGMNGRFVAKVSPQSAFIKDYFQMYPTAPKLRPDRVPMSLLQESAYVITVGDVGKNNKQVEHIEQVKYSVVRNVRLNW